MKKTNAIMLFILGGLLVFSGIMALYYEYASEIYFTCGAFCILEAIVIFFSKNHIGINIVLAFFIGLTILVFILFRNIIIPLPFLLVAIVCIVILKASDEREKDN